MTEIERLREALYKALRAYQLGEHPDNSIAIGALTLDLSAVYLAVESVLAATPPSAEGWKLVPVEPTPEMYGAGNRVLHVEGGEIGGVWIAMLAAAPPSPPASEK